MSSFFAKQAAKKFGNTKLSMEQKLRLAEEYLIKLKNLAQRFMALVLVHQ